MNVKTSLCSWFRAIAALDVGQHIIIEDHGVSAVVEGRDRAGLDPCADGPLADAVALALQTAVDGVDGPETDGPGCVLAGFHVVDLL